MKYFPGVLHATTVRSLGCLLVGIMTCGPACGQRNLTEITGKDEVSVQYEFIGKAGTTKKFSLDLRDVPNAPPIPDAYRSLGNKGYLIRSDAVIYGETVLSFKVPVSKQEEFDKVRVLYLVPDELSPSGYGWRDCTMTPALWLDPHEEQYSSAERKARLNKFLPNYSQKQVSCFVDGIDPENYFVLSLQTQEVPREPLTQIKISLVSERQSETVGETIYQVSFKNTGNKDVAEVNFYSVFDTDTRVTSSKPSQGKCQKSSFFSSFGSSICHLGPLAAGASATVEFTGIPSGMGASSPQATKRNLGWSIDGFIKETPNSPTWGVNGFQVQPFIDK